MTRFDGSRSAGATTTPPTREVRALFDEQTIRVYQAFSPEIAEPALQAQTFKSPFKRGRMTWIKPSWTWMMYRCGYASKPGQERVLGIDIRRSGFEWALAHSSLSHFDSELHPTWQTWRDSMDRAPVRIQWDPERTVRLEALPWRTIQIGLSGEAVDLYLDQWIVRIEDVTPRVREIDQALRQNNVSRAMHGLPVEAPYPLAAEISRAIGAA